MLKTQICVIRSQCVNTTVRLWYSFRLLTDCDSPGALLVTTYIPVAIGRPFDTFVCNFKLENEIICFVLSCLQVCKMTMMSVCDFCWILEAFAKMRKAAVGLLMSVCLSVRPHGTARLPLDRFS